MGNVCDCCSKKQGDYNSFPGLKKESEDQKSLLKKEDKNSDSIIQLSTTPTPLLQNINFAVIDDNNDNNDDTESSSIDEEKIEELLNEEEDQQTNSKQ